MSTGVRLIVLLTLTVGVVMAGAGYFILSQREAILVAALRNELAAHAHTLQIALEDDYRSGRISDAQRLIDRLSANPKVYSVILFDEEGHVAMLSDPLIAGEVRSPTEARRVIESGAPVEFERRIKGQQVFSIIMPVRVTATRRGAFEISQPLTLIRADITRARRDIGLITSLLFAVILLVVLFVTRSSLLRPLRELRGAVGALESGDLSYRAIVTRGGSELKELARGFNRMADSLAEQRRVVIREAEDRLELERALRHSERLASVGRLAAGVAHEMGSPLNVIDARAGLLLSSDLPQEAHRNLTIIRTQVARITRIVRELLNLARPYQLKCRPVELSQLVAAAAELIEPDAQRRGVDVFVRANGSTRVNVDPDLILQVLVNICNNGVQAMLNGGRLCIEVINAGGTNHVGDMAAVRVSDTGPGLSSEDLAHIFEPFYTTKEIGKGTGLGLSVSHRIVEEHGGRIEVANDSSGGAVFTVYLPKATAETAHRPGKP